LLADIHRRLVLIRLRQNAILADHSAASLNSEPLGQ
jgi:hypothetical protein